MKPLSNWRVNPQPSTGPSVRGPSPDPERHHPELGNARLHAERHAAENAPAIYIPADTPSPRPGAGSPVYFDLTQSPPRQNPAPGPSGQHGHPHDPVFGLMIPADRPSLPGGQPVLPQAPPSPFDRSVALQPLDRGQSNTGMEPQFAPLRPYSPSEAYLPGPNADPHVENLHREMVGHNFATFMHHPQAPMAPAGRFVLEPSIADALLQFRGQVRSMPDPYQEYAQTYRMVDGNRLEPVRPQPITGFMNEVRLPEGSFPPGTGLVIHSHPPRRDGMIIPARPSEADMLRAYQDRTNLLQDPRSNVTSHILYDHATDSAFIYDGRLGPDGNPRYYQAVLPPSYMAPNQAQMPHHPVAERALAHPEIPAPVQAHVPPELPIAAPVAQRPAPGNAAPRSPERPASPPQPGSPAWDEWMQFPASRAATPPSPTPWDHWMDFGPKTPPA